MTGSPLEESIGSIVTEIDDQTGQLLTLYWRAESLARGLARGRGMDGELVQTELDCVNMRIQGMGRIIEELEDKKLKLLGIKK